MSVELAPFTQPEHAKLDDWHAKEAESLLIYSDKSYAVNIGRNILRGGSIMLPTHFHELARTMQSAEQEHSFKRGACLGLAIISLKATVKLSDEAVIGHVESLHQYRKPGESSSEAAQRIGDTMLELDGNLAKCAEKVVFIHPGKQYLPSAMQAGVGYAQTIAERAISIATLDEQYSEELSGIFDDIEK